MKRIIAGIATLTAVAIVAAPAGASANDPYLSHQWALKKIGAEQAWATSTGSNVLVAVVDTGVDLTHPDLQANIVSYPDADLVDPNGACTTTKKGASSCVQDGAQDLNGHGTHVAGIIAADANNGIGVAGVAPDAKILPVRVLDQYGDGTTDDVAGGIHYAADRGARIINLSLGLDPRGHAAKILGQLRSIYSAVTYATSKGALVVIAAGNDSFPICGEPAADPAVLCVGSTDKRDEISWFSNYDAAQSHPNYLVAPGGSAASTLTLGAFHALCDEDIFSTYLRSVGSYCSDEKGYESDAGTSMAAPHVSGVAALLAAKGLTNDEIVACLKTTSEDLGAPGRDPIYGYGRINAARAVSNC
ncbi:MAG TPA: S8 family serine peptidase [Actinomycetota bacterium]|nr:S8 family serine peptidase [Actinomycetota bacterium]